MAPVAASPEVPSDIVEMSGGAVLCDDVAWSRTSSGTGVSLQRIHRIFRYSVMRFSVRRFVSCRSGFSPTIRAEKKFPRGDRRAR
jgi:hypothetical protein